MPKLGLFLEQMDLADELKVFFNQSALAKRMLQTHSLTVEVNARGQVSVKATRKPVIDDLFDRVEHVVARFAGKGGSTLDASDLPDLTPRT